MWCLKKINSVIQINKDICFSDSFPLNHERNGIGESLRLFIGEKGFVDFTNLEVLSKGRNTFCLVLNNIKYPYTETGELELTVINDKEILVQGNGNEFICKLHKNSAIADWNIDIFDWMFQKKYIPYQNIPDEPGKTTEEIRSLGRQFFPFSDHSFEMAMSLYDWTTADFTRIDFLNLFTYTGLKGNPLDDDSIANSIWTANWPPYTPKDKDYMNSFMMEPADSFNEVNSQLQEKKDRLKECVIAESNIILASLKSMPRTSCFKVPNLYSGQVAISNLGPDHFATYFNEFPLNNDPNLPPLKMSLNDAINSFMSVGKDITLKSFMSFTDSYKDAQHYSNGIVIIVSPPDGHILWENCAYITPLSDGPDKTEYLFEIGTSFRVEDIKIQNDVTEFYLKVNVKPSNCNEKVVDNNFALSKKG